MEEALAGVETPYAAASGCRDAPYRHHHRMPTVATNPASIEEIFLAENAPDASSTLNQQDNTVDDIRAVDLF